MRTSGSRLRSDGRIEWNVDKYQALVGDNALLVGDQVGDSWRCEVNHRIETLRPELVSAFTAGCPDVTNRGEISTTFGAARRNGCANELAGCMASRTNDIKNRMRCIGSVSGARSVVSTDAARRSQLRKTKQHPSYGRGDHELVDRITNETGVGDNRILAMALGAA